MTQNECMSELRRLCGNPDLEGPEGVSTPELLRYLLAGLRDLASLLEYAIRQDDTTFALVTGDYSYAIPNDMLEVLEVYWNGVKLTPSSTGEWDRDGRNWQHATNGTPGEFALEGRTLFLSPPPGANAVTSDSALSVRYIASSPGVSASGMPGLSDADQDVALLLAAQEWCGQHNEDGKQAARLAGLSGRLTPLLRAAKQRRENMVRDYYPAHAVFARRQGGAR